MVAERSRREADARYELKMACHDAARPRVLMALALHPFAVRTLYPPRQVQSIYLDTLDRRALRENLAGISQREKLRFRWYGPARDRARGSLERKVREGGLGWKDVYPLPGEVRLEGAPRRAFVASLARLAPRAIEAGLENLYEPVQWISYRREYLATADRALRITVDRELRSWDQRLRPALGARGHNPLPRLLVVEVKCSLAASAQARALVERLPLVVDRCSKFVLASDPAHGPIPSVL